MFAEIQSAIIARLSATMDPEVRVLTLAELADVPDHRQKTPAVFVVYEGFRPAAVAPTVPHIQQIEQQWTVVVACKSSRGAGNTDAAREDVSAIAQRVLEALLGFQVAPGARLQLAGAPGPEFDGGFAYLPVGFLCRTTFKGSAS